MAAEGMPFSWRGNGGTISTNLDGILKAVGARPEPVDRGVWPFTWSGATVPSHRDLPKIGENDYFVILLILVMLLPKIYNSIGESLIRYILKH